MLQRSQPHLATLLFLALEITIVLLSAGCRHRSRPGGNEGEDKLRGEPDRYSATIVRTIEDGGEREPNTIREARSGEQRREEWTEQGHNRAVIWRPDLGKCYLLDLDLLVFVEISVGETNQSLPDQSRLPDRSGNNSESALVQIDRAVDDAPSPDRVETRMLAGANIAGHSCTVYEERATFPDGHTEITRTFRAGDLDGLALRIESESEPSSVRVITERKDVSLEVAPDTFTVPSNFKKVDKLEVSNKEHM
jgi:hypothetical protein